jgi:hypothetical protein
MCSGSKTVSGSWKWKLRKLWSGACASSAMTERGDGMTDGHIDPADMRIESWNDNVDNSRLHRVWGWSGRKITYVLSSGKSVLPTHERAGNRSRSAISSIKEIPEQNFRFRHEQNDVFPVLWKTDGWCYSSRFMCYRLSRKWVAKSK